MPVSVQAVLAARIDRLNPDAKHLLQAASVVGKEVAEPTLVLIRDSTRKRMRGDRSPS